MANLTNFTVAVSIGCVLTYYSNRDATIYLYTKSSILSLLALCLFLLIYNLLIHPFYTSPLLVIPTAPYNWKRVFSILNGGHALNIINSTPNNGLIRTVDMLNTELLIITKPSVVNEFLSTRAEDFQSSPSMGRIFRDMFGNGILSADGSAHKSMRKIMAPAFSYRTIKELYPLFWLKACEAVLLVKDEIKRKSLGESAVVNIEDWAGRVALDIIGEAGFGSRFDSLTNPHNAVTQSYHAAFLVDESTRPLFLLSMITRPWITNMLPIRKVRERLAGLAAINQWVKEYIEARKKEMYTNVDDLTYFEKSGHRDVISHVLKTGEMTISELVDQSKTLLAAGHETSATAFTWAIHLLSQPSNHHIQARLREEIRRNLPSPESGLEITAEMLDNLPYLDAVSKESMRMYAPVPSIGRMAVRDTTLGGVMVPKGTMIRAYPWAMSLSRELWGEDATVFNPERWLGEKMSSVKGVSDPLALLTFGHGPRGCIGKGFAIGENKALLSAFVGSFEFSHIGGKERKDTSVAFAVVAKIIGGVNVEVTPLGSW